MLGDRVPRVVREPLARIRSAPASRTSGAACAASRPRRAATAARARARRRSRSASGADRSGAGCGSRARRRRRRARRPSPGAGSRRAGAAAGAGSASASCVFGQTEYCIAWPSPSRYGTQLKYGASNGLLWVLMKSALHDAVEDVRSAQVDEVVDRRVLQALDLQLRVGLDVGRDEGRRRDAEHVLGELLLVHQLRARERPSA